MQRARRFRRTKAVVVDFAIENRRRTVSGHAMFPHGNYFVC